MAMARRRLLALASRLQARALAPPATQPWRRAQPRLLSSVVSSGSLDRLKTPSFARPAARNPALSPWDRFGGVIRVFYGSDFVTVTKSEETSWDYLKPEIFAAIMDFYSSGQPLFLDSNTAASMDTAIHEDDSEIVAMIKELLETRIRPAVQDDGGDIEYRGFDPLRIRDSEVKNARCLQRLSKFIRDFEVKRVEQEFDGDEEAELAGQME
ncbi:hypothetical protein PR202_ga11321 [Eleusine coracana subsp. coracana]|uniref:Scaffold protein Nfu/NifU N-terminal domain-containing protein n=1 Tax=Eleusine coracana subsp. coracana TaxID=191504 RepID=A0AAV5C972_ELECO|nr:hypothetical protein PR202_ga11321 [Eleusine coracana subsp. coracana]